MDISNDATLVRYLLGRLPPGDTEKLDEQSVVDPEFTDRLRGIEHDLADAYARGELSEDDRRRWERIFGASAAGRDQLRFAEALATRERRTKILPARFGPSRSRRLVRLAMVGLVAASLALAVGVGYSIHWGSPAPASLAPSNASTAPATTPPTAPRSEVAPTPARTIVAITLPIPTRGITPAPPLTIPAGTDDVQVSLRLAPDEFSRYAVDARELSSQRVVWHGADLAPVERSGERVLLCTVPADVLRAGRFAFELHGAVPRESDVLGSYLLNIER